MRKWYKYILQSNGNGHAEAVIAKDRLPDEHKATMGGFTTESGYQSKEQFFEKFLLNGDARFKFYCDYVMRHARKDEQGLSIGSGRCVSETYLNEQGFNIICSDLENYCEYKTKSLFPNLKFNLFDISQGPFPSPVDFVMCLSVLYLFNEEELERVFRHVAASLKPGGKFFVDPGGAQDSPATRLVDEVICKYETKMRFAVMRAFRNGKSRLALKHAGYRSTNEEIQAIAKKAGFSLCDLRSFDNVTELKGRSLIFNKIPAAIVSPLGKKMPYVRMFFFRKD